MKWFFRNFRKEKVKKNQKAISEKKHGLHGLEYVSGVKDATTGMLGFVVIISLLFLCKIS